FLVEVESLLVALAERDKHSATVPQLVDERLRDVLRRARDDDFVEGCMLGPPLIAIPDLNLHILVAQIAKALLGFLTERLNNLDGIDLLDDLGQDGRLIAASRADF